jgi:hypothetical protein
VLLWHACLQAIAYDNMRPRASELDELRSTGEGHNLPLMVSFSWVEDSRPTALISPEHYKMDVGSVMYFTACD